MGTRLSSNDAVVASVGCGAPPNTIRTLLARPLIARLGSPNRAPVQASRPAALMPRSEFRAGTRQAGALCVAYVVRALKVLFALDALLVADLARRARHPTGVAGLHRALLVLGAFLRVSRGRWDISL